METERVYRHTQHISGFWQVCAVDFAPAHAMTEAPGACHDVPFDIPDSTHLQPARYPENPYWGEHVRAINDHAWLYRKVFTPADVPYRRARLRFEGIDYYADVWLNGHYLGHHEGNFNPFEFDVTDYLLSGENNLQVRVSSPWDPPEPGGMYPTSHVRRRLVKGLYEHGEGLIPPDVNPLGIWRPVSLVLDNGVSVDHIRVRAGTDGRVALRVAITNATGEPLHGTLHLAARADNHDGPGAAQAISLTLPRGRSSHDATLTIPEPRLWWPWDHGAPNLYHLDVTLTDADGTPLADDAVTFGLRTVTLERSPERFVYRINGREVFIRGISYMPGLYLSQKTRADFAHDIQLARDAHMNLLRVHVHVSPDDVYELADRAGMLVWQDFELNWVHDDSPVFEARARRLQREMIDLLYNHPSIITWACHNEPTMILTERRNLTRPDRALYHDACAQDPTRPVFMASGQLEGDWRRSGDSHAYLGAIWSRRYTDITRYHYRLVTEFGFEAPANAQTLREYDDVWQRLGHLTPQIDVLHAYQDELVQYQIEYIRRLRTRGCAGYMLFQLVDLVPQVGCGVLDSARRAKGGYAALERASRVLHVALAHDGRRPQAVWIMNDTPHPYEDATLKWTICDCNGKPLQQGHRPMTVPANTTFEAVRLTNGFKLERCETVSLMLQSADGATLAENRYTRPFQPMERPRGYPWKFDTHLACKVFDRHDAISMAEIGAEGAVNLIPLAVRHRAAEWMFRQRFPLWFTGFTSWLVDSLKRLRLR